MARATVRVPDRVPAPVRLPVPFARAPARAARAPAPVDAAAPVVVRTLFTGGGHRAAPSRGPPRDAGVGLRCAPPRPRWAATAAARRGPVDEWRREIDRDADGEDSGDDDDEIVCTLTASSASLRAASEGGGGAVGLIGGTEVAGVPEMRQRLLEGAAGPVVVAPPSSRSYLTSADPTADVPSRMP